VYVTFDVWKKVSMQSNFEAGSAWGTSAPRNFTPPKLQLATTGRNAAPKNVGGRMVYEVENLPFKASQPIEVLSALDAAANKVHKLHAVQVGITATGSSTQLTCPRPEPTTWTCAICKMRGRSTI
jgi:hypothetical protein